jgi:phosphatidylserine decarboxylase
MIHQYIHRKTGAVKTEKLFADKIINLIYSTAREKVPVLYKAAASARASAILGYLNYSMAGGSRLTGAEKIIRELGINLAECVDPPAALDSPEKIFERKIQYWDRRPMSIDPEAVASPADAKIIIGSFERQAQIFLKEKFFSFDELFCAGPGAGAESPELTAQWPAAFAGGDFAVLRLTPEKYHYNHAPVTGKVLDIYEIDGLYHSCNPSAIVHSVTPLSKNKRVVTIMDTDIPGGSRVGLVAMIEVVALMIGKIVQCYSDFQYRAPRPVTPGMVLEKGQPKSLYRPGSSVDVLIFQKDKIQFCPDIVSNMYRIDAQSRFSLGFGQPLVETEVDVRSTIAFRRK